MEILIGADPEIFLKDRKTGKFVSAAGFFPGTKTEPFKIRKGAVQVDGVALEFNIDPAKDETEFVENINTVLSQLEEMVQKVNADWEMAFVPLATFTPGDWEKIPADAKILGCDPDYGFAGIVNPNPSEKFNRYMPTSRTASGHIHIGWTKDENVSDPLHFEDCRFIANDSYMNRWFKNPPLGISHRDEHTRLNYYGHSGAFRPKTYGVELREPSNVWVGDKQRIATTYRVVRQRFEIAAGLSK